jgi:hypothetical protein
MKTYQESPNTAECRGGKAWRYSAWMVSVALMTQASIASAVPKQEQTLFNADPSEGIARPVPVPDSVLETLANDAFVVACVKDNRIPSNTAPPSWFAASEIHLDGPNETDIVVLPVALGSPYFCFHSAEGFGWFWVFRKTGKQYEPVLKTSGLGLRVLDSKHHGYRDLQSESQIGGTNRETRFRFENGRYRVYQKEAEKQR